MTSIKTVLTSLTFCLCLGLFSACSFVQDSIDKPVATKRVLRNYEETQNPDEIRQWLVKYHGEAPGHEVMIAFAEWSLTNQRDFITIVEGLKIEEQKKFIERFAFALHDTASQNKFKTAFKDFSSGTVDSIVFELKKFEDG